MNPFQGNRRDRRSFIGGSDARIVMGNDEATLLRLWKEKRGEIEPEDLSEDLLVQLGTITEPLNRHWYEKNAGQIITDVQKQVFHAVRSYHNRDRHQDSNLYKFEVVLCRRSAARVRRMAYRLYLKTFLPKLQGDSLQTYHG